MYSRIVIAVAALFMASGAWAQGGPGPAPKKLDGPRRDGVQTYWLKDAQGNYAGSVAMRPEDLMTKWEPPEGLTVTTAAPPIPEKTDSLVAIFTRETPGDRSTPVVIVGQPFMCGSDQNPCPTDLPEGQFIASAKPDGTRDKKQRPDPLADLQKRIDALEKRGNPKP